MTMQQLRDEFYKLRQDDADFSELFDGTSEGFQSWLDAFCLGSDD